ncbi:MAG TPA: AAA family ATPase, partial [Thermoanaerobaculia bacterium]|nr:AAA family ATPase [Thermoanaerobaculia bacterium]
AAKKEGLEQSGILELWSADGDIAPLGGLANLKSWLQRFRVGWSDHAKSLGLGPPRGVLLVGVQGCGKSLAAKTIAHEWGLPLVRLDPGRLYDKYIGESERHLRNAFATAEALSPLVLWIDEIEKVFAAGGSESDGGLGRRLFGSFLTWMQEKKEAVFVAATSNDLSAVPPELLRKGRFDEIFFVDLPGAPERREILAIHLRLRRQDPAVFDLDILTEATEGMSGAEIEQAVVAALYGMLAERETRLTTPRLLLEIGRTVPLSRSRREQVTALQALARERFVLAG